MERRDFLKCTGKACAGIGLGLAFSNFLSSCGTSLSVLKAKQNQGWVEVPLSSFEQSNYVMLRVSGFAFDLGIEKKEDNKFLPLVLMCPHARQPITKTANGYLCTLHGSKFSKDGDLLKGPSALPLYHLPYEEKDGMLRIHTGSFKG